MFRRTVKTGVVLVVGAVTTLATAVLPPAAADDGAFTTWVPTESLASSSFERVPQNADGDSPEPAPRRLSMPAVRNAPASGQLAITANKDLKNLSVDVVARGLPGGVRPLPEDAVSVRYPGYVPVTGTPEVIADPLEEGPVDVAAGHNQPIWLTINIPRSLQPASYGVQLRIGADGVDPIVHEVVVEVADVVVSDPADYDFYLNLWLQPDSVAYEHNVPIHSEEHWSLLTPYLDDLASRGQKVINAAIIEDPWEIGWANGTWRAQTYYPFHSLVEWTYDGQTWDFDYEAFDRYVQESRNAGVGPDIRVYALLMFGGRERLFYRDTRTGETVREVVELGDPRWREAWSAFLHDFEDHLRQRGWFENTMLAFDERPSSTMQVVQDFLAESAPAFENKIHIAVYSTDVDHSLPDISYILGILPQLDDSVLEERREAGHRTTFYTIGDPAIPNTITTSPPVSARLLPWVAKQYQIDGFLRWSYNSWPSDDPRTDPAYRYSQGDEYIVYPGSKGPTSSIRWETFRDGVIDHELLTQLARLAGDNNPAYRQALSLVDASAQPSAQMYADVLTARARVVSELEQFRGVEITTEVDLDTVVAGELIEVNSTVRNDSSQPLLGVQVNLEPKQDSWTIERVDGGQAVRLLPGEELHSVSAVKVAETAASRSEDYLITTVDLRREGQPISLQTHTPLQVISVAGLNALTADPTDLNRGDPTTLTADVVNRSESPTSADVSVTAPDGWTISPDIRSVQLEPKAEKAVTFQATPAPDAPSGRQLLRGEVSVGGRVVEQAVIDVFYNEVPVTDAVIHSVSSEELEGEDGAAANLVDGDPQTHWHSQWFARVDQPPHEVVLDLGSQRTTHALTYLPRQTGTLNGTVKDYEVYVGSPGAWGEPVNTGAFAGGRDQKRIDFSPTSGRYLRFVALSEQAGQPFASGAELTAMAAAR